MEALEKPALVDIVRALDEWKRKRAELEDRQGMTDMEMFALKLAKETWPVDVRSSAYAPSGVMVLFEGKITCCPTAYKALRKLCTSEPNYASILRLV